MSELIFVYALDGDLFSEISSYAHKVFSPRTYPCNLCALTNGMLGSKREWTRFIGEIAIRITRGCRELGIKTEFLHQDEFNQRYPTQQHSFPAAFRSTGNGELELLMTSTEIDECRDLSALISLVTERAK